MQSIIRDHHKQLYAPQKMDSLKEMDKFWETYNFPRLNQEEIENLNRPITSNETESVIKKKKPPTSKSSGPESFTDESDKHLKS